MPLQSLVQIEDSENHEMIVIPTLDDFETLSSDDLASKDGVLVLKNKLIMREGEHNSVFYSWEELKGAIETGEGAGLYYDHADSTGNWVGDIRNLRGDDTEKAIYADVHIVDPVAARKLRYGAKWGLSPSIDAEKLIRDGKKYALDPKIISCSLVLRPAVRETMLNEEDIAERRSKEKSMTEELEEKKAREIEELAKKKVKDDEDKKKKDEELKELKEKVEKFENEDLERKSKEVLSHGVGFGILVEEDMDELKELSDKGRAFVSKVIDRVSETLKLDKEDDDDDDDDDKDKSDLKENYIKFRARFMKKNPKATEADVKKAFAKLEEDAKNKKKKEYPYPYPKPKTKLDEDQERLREDLADREAYDKKVNAGMLALMQEQH